MMAKLISGGQTGVDRAAIDVGLALGLAVGGWCPKGRRAENGVIPDCYRWWKPRSATTRPAPSAISTTIGTRTFFYDDL